MDAEHTVFPFKESLAHFVHPTAIIKFSHLFPVNDLWDTPDKSDQVWVFYFFPIHKVSRPVQSIKGNQAGLTQLFLTAPFLLLLTALLSSDVKASEL